MYKLVKNPITNEIIVVVKQDGLLLLNIPFDPANTDYQQYLAWVAEGNTPEPADEDSQ